MSINPKVCAAGFTCTLRLRYTLPYHCTILCLHTPNSKYTSNEQVLPGMQIYLFFEMQVYSETQVHSIMYGKKQIQGGIQLQSSLGTCM